MLFSFRRISTVHVFIVAFAAMWFAVLTEPEALVEKAREISRNFPPKPFTSHMNTGLPKSMGKSNNIAKATERGTSEAKSMANDCPCSNASSGSRTTK